MEFTRKELESIKPMKYFTEDPSNRLNCGVGPNGQAAFRGFGSPSHAIHQETFLRKGELSRENTPNKTRTMQFATTPLNYVSFNNVETEDSLRHSIHGNLKKSENNVRERGIFVPIEQPICYFPRHIGGEDTRSLMKSNYSSK